MNLPDKAGRHQNAARGKQQKSAPERTWLVEAHHERKYTWNILPYGIKKQPAFSLWYVTMSDDRSPDHDFDLIRRVTQGEINAFQPLLEKYQNYVFTVVSRHAPKDEVEEIAQEIFMKAYCSLPTFKFKTGFKQWLSAIAVRACYDYWRVVYRTRETPLSSFTDDEQILIDRISAKHTENIQLAKKDARDLIQWALGRLSPEDRMVLELVHLEGYSAREAGFLLGWSVANVKVRAFRSRKKLRTLLQRIFKEDNIR